MGADLGLTDTIAAIATARGRGAIGIVKISGPLAWPMAQRLFVPKRSEAKTGSGGSGGDVSHLLQYGWISHPHTAERIDEVLLARMRGPHTYTGEDVVEINAHGGPRILAQILDAVVDCGARLAEPGEFTRRALINGRIDLSQAEAVADLIDARSRRAIAIAGRALSGELGQRIEEVRQRILGLLARINAEIDFGEQLEAENDPLEIAVEVREKIAPVLAQWIDHYQQQRGYIEGLKVAAVGRPNVGKSSIINRLVRKERLIVTSVPGTTRDLVDVAITIGDLPLMITDTAGLHPSKDPVESIGIEKTQRYLDECELILFVIDAARPFCQDDDRICKMLEDRPVAVIFNKMDLHEKKRPLQLPDHWPKWKTIKISARYDQSMESLENFVRKHLETGETETVGDIVPNLRQCRLMQDSLEHLHAAAQRLADEGDIDLGGLELNEGMKALERILGRSGGEVILDEVFKRFCIGK